jgi:hypothetical protein
MHTPSDRRTVCFKAFASISWLMSRGRNIFFAAVPLASVPFADARSPS